MSDEEYNWDEYYQKIQGREPRQFLLDVLVKYPSGETLHAIDLGCGDGTETAFLLSRGWSVIAVDGAGRASNGCWIKCRRRHRTVCRLWLRSSKRSLCRPPT